MHDTNKTASTGPWTNLQAYTVAAVCLLIGMAGGWFVRGSRTPAGTSPVKNLAPAPVAMGGAMAGGMTPADQMKQMADTQAAPLLEKLKSDPRNPDLLAAVGDLYYDAQQYLTAIDYYKKSLDLQPKQSAVRTDLGTAYWYLGNADTAIEEFNRVLKDEPTNPNTLLNLGIVKLHGKMDVDGAVAAWQKLLHDNPNYENKDKVQQLIQQAKKH